MNYNDFLVKVKQSVQEKAGKEYEVIIRQVSKNNGVMLAGLSIGRRQDTGYHGSRCVSATLL